MQAKYIKNTTNKQKKNYNKHKKCITLINSRKHYQDTHEYPECETKKENNAFNS